MSAEYLFTFDAIDVLGLRHDDESALVFYIASRDVAHVNRVTADLVRDAGLHDPDDDGSDIENPVNALKPDSDLFFWLLWRWETDPKISSDLTLTVFRTVAVFDGIRAETRVLKYVALDRPDVQALVGDPRSNFGPAKFALFDRALQLHADIFLLLDGRYEVMVQESWWAASPDEADEVLDEMKEQQELAAASGGELPRVRPPRPVFYWPDRPEFGVEIALHVGETVLPKLYSAYRSDKKWTKGGRDAFRADADKRTIGRIGARRRAAGKD